MMIYFGRMSSANKRFMNALKNRTLKRDKRKKGQDKKTSKKQKTEDNRIARQKAEERRQKKAQEKRQDDVVKKINDLELSNLFPYLNSAKVQVVKNKPINSIIADMIMS